MSEGEMSIKIDYLERAHMDELKARRYTHNMLEDLGEKLSNLERSAERFEADLHNRMGNDTNTREWLGGIDGRLRTIERLVWIAVGGVVVVGGLTAIIGGNIMQLLSR
jgi:hypothetical protein